MSAICQCQRAVSKAPGRGIPSSSWRPHPRDSRRCCISDPGRLRWETERTRFRFWTALGHLHTGPSVPRPHLTLTFTSHALIEHGLLQALARTTANRHAYPVNMSLAAADYIHKVPHSNCKIRVEAPEMETSRSQSIIMYLSKVPHFCHCSFYDSSQHQLFRGAFSEMHLTIICLSG
ncbi:hypothetical protein F4677DRAFT_237748 [Hypoxylon crocopeplum]|nr:hypothetical protein F4677DRAFT_237748 [Hypoxylon crocopeplum]